MTDRRLCNNFYVAVGIEGNMSTANGGLAAENGTDNN
jgi:hypothetical protein